MELVTVTAAMGSLLPALAELLREEYALQEGARARVRQFSGDLKRMRAALCSAAETPLRPPPPASFRLWARDARRLCHDLEDAVDDFLLLLRGVASPGHAADQEDMLIRPMAKVADHLLRHRMFSDAIAERQPRDDTPTEHDPPRRKAASSTRLVGIDGPRDEVTEMLSMGDQSKLRIVSIFGFGGSGKTTLAKAVYDKLRPGFQCGAFVTVGRNGHDMSRVFRDILHHLDRKDFTRLKMVNLDEKQLITKLQEYLQSKRYFIVIDDLWHMNSWNTIRFVLPDSDHGSKVVTTTRFSNIARDVGDVYNLQPLSHGISKKLLCTRLFDDEGKCLERQSAEASDNFLEKCGGNPLGIIAIAGLLASKTEDDWSGIYNSIGFEDGINDVVQNTRRILSFCYYDMPSHLRTCLLYLSIFREDYEINKSLLIWKWIAEGLIHDEQDIGLFELGEGYLNELIIRGMILQPVEAHGTGYEIGCRVHDMVLDLVRSLSSEENFVTLLSSDEDHQNLSLTDANRIALQSRTVEKYHPQLAYVDMGQMRSFVAILSNIPVIPPSFQVLRVLALEDCKFIEGYTSNGLEHLGKLLHLRYLGLTRTHGFHRLPEEIGQDLKFLQTLDLYETDLEEVPFNVGLMTQLLCLRVDVGTRVPTGLITNLTSLQELWIYPTMKGYTIGSQFVKDLGKLRELRVLKTWILGWDQSMEIALVESLHNFHKIQHLELSGESYLGKGVTWEAGFPSSVHLRYLSLACMQLTRLPAWMNSSLLPNLSHLVVNVQFMQEQDMETLGRMPELRSLELQSCNKRVVNIKNSCGHIGYFQKLRSLISYSILILFGLDRSGVGIDAPATMPNLEYLQFTVHVRFLKDANHGFDKIISENLS
ncbi:disease resistance protein Pik-2-like, partial [Oryza brachyantha]|uniref:disease resistance protein Pik-2-like n=1 Tax=Oryza brachyantha TaxID=4533 RepID=UPI001ADBDA48